MFDESLLDQKAQGLTQGRPADLEPLGQLLLYQPFAGLES